MQPLSGDTLKTLMIGATHYVDVGKPTPAAIYYPSDTVAHMTLPDGPTLKGTLTLNDTGYHIAWDGGPAGDWQITHEPGAFIYTRPDGSAGGGPVTKIVPGNPEGF